jgi:hypothetical protein
MVVVDAPEHHQLLLELLDLPAHDGVDVLVGERIGPAAGDPGQAIERGGHGRPGSPERAALGGQIDHLHVPTSLRRGRGDASGSAWGRKGVFLP